MPSALQLREVVDPGDPAIARAYKLLRQTFHKAELVHLSEWRQSLRERDADLWTDVKWHLVVAEEGGTVVGVTTGLYLGNVNTGVIGYLAVSSAARGAGVGPKLRARIRALFRRDARQVVSQPLQAVIGEVRRDNPWLRTLIRRERVLALNFEYLQPRLGHGAKAVPLVLYYESFDRPLRRLPTALIRKLLYTTWRRGYRIARPMADNAFRRMLAGIAGKTSVGELTERELDRDRTARLVRLPRAKRHPRRS